MNDEIPEVIPEEAAPQPAPFPWPPQPDDSAIEAFVQTWRQACFQPTSFFRRMPEEARFGPVLLYYLVLGIIVSGVRLFWTSLFHVVGLSNPAERLIEGQSQGSPIVDFLLSPILLLAALYITAGICHVILLMLRGANRSFQTSLRVFAFSYSPALFAVVPFLGGLVAIIWMLPLSIIGLREAHHTDGSKAAVAVLVPFFLAFTLGVLLAILIVATGLLQHL